MNKFDEAINYVNHMNETYLEHTKNRSGQTGFGQWPYLVKKALERGKKLEERNIDIDNYDYNEMIKYKDLLLELIKVREIES